MNIVNVSAMLHNIDVRDTITNSNGRVRVLLVPGQVYHPKEFIPEYDITRVSEGVKDVMLLELYLSSRVATTGLLGQKWSDYVLGVVFSRSPGITVPVPIMSLIITDDRGVNLYLVM